MFTGLYSQSSFTTEHEMFKQDLQASCEHEYRQWEGNPMLNMCNKCGNWYQRNYSN